MLENIEWAILVFIWRKNQATWTVFEFFPSRDANCLSHISSLILKLDQQYLFCFLAWTEVDFGETHLYNRTKVKSYDQVLICAFRSQSLSSSDRPSRFGRAVYSLWTFLYNKALRVVWRDDESLRRRGAVRVHATYLVALSPATPLSGPGYP